MRESIAPQLAEVKVLSATALGISNTKRLVSSSGFKPFRCGKERVYSSGGGLRLLSVEFSGIIRAA